MQRNQYRPALGVCLTRGFVPQSRSPEFKEQRKGEGDATTTQRQVCVYSFEQSGVAWKKKKNTHETNKKKRCNDNLPIALSHPSCQDVMLLGRDGSVCVCVRVSVLRQSVAALRCRYLSELVAWRSGGRWRRPEGGSPSLVRGCCWEESWPVGTSPFWASATHTHTFLCEDFTLTSIHFPFFQTAQPKPRHAWA